MISVRLRTKVADEAIEALAGKVLGHSDYDLLLTGRVTVLKPDGRPLCVYLPGVLAEPMTDEVYDILHSLKGLTTSNRGMASGTKRLRRGQGEAVSSRTESVPIASTVVGAVDPMGQRAFCRLTAWTGKNFPQWEQLHPLLRAIDAQFAAQVPARYAAQRAHAERTDPAWIVPGTVFSTITVNNTYPTGTHTDRGDLDEGFSSIACLRRGDYSGGQLIFPQFRVAADLRQGDLILMDAHEWHANVPIVCACGTRCNGPCRECGAERISIVSYMRTAITACGTPEAEHARALEQAERRSKLTPTPGPAVTEDTDETDEQAELARETVTPLASGGGA